MGIKDLKEKIKIEIDERRVRSIEMAEHIFDNPEIAYKEHETQKYLAKELVENGFTVEEGVGGYETAYKAEFDCKKNGPGVAFLAEYDALPELGHACHHHLIASAAVNVAITMSKISEDLCGKIYCIGTPAEEVANVKGTMFERGVFNGIDVSLMFHGGCKDSTNVIVLANDVIEVEYKGKSAHAAASPHEGINALDAVIMLFNAINARRQQLREDVRIHGIVLKGGDAVNIIPETASARFVVRAKDRKYLEEVVGIVKECGKGAALQTGATMKISSNKIGNDLFKNTSLAQEFEKNMRSLGRNVDSEAILLGSSDIGNLSYYMPVLHPMIKTGADGSVLHTREFLMCGKTDVAFQGMIEAMNSLSMTGIRVLMDHGFLHEVKEEFKAIT